MRNMFYFLTGIQIIVPKASKVFFYYLFKFTFPWYIFFMKYQKFMKITFRNINVS